jgi:hypothetical protein
MLLTIAAGACVARATSVASTAAAAEPAGGSCAACENTGISGVASRDSAGRSLGRSELGEDEAERGRGATETGRKEYRGVDCGGATEASFSRGGLTDGFAGGVVVRTGCFVAAWNGGTERGAIERAGCFALACRASAAVGVAGVGSSSQSRSISSVTLGVDESEGMRVPPIQKRI